MPLACYCGGLEGLMLMLDHELSQLLAEMKPQAELMLEVQPE